ncbi:hypothetical protein [Sinomonas atrocyanea]
MLAAVPAHDPRRRAVAALLAIEAVSLATVSALHLTGVLGGGTPPYNPTAAGIAEGLIGAVLLAAAVAVVRSPKHGYAAAQAGSGFAVAGFVLGLVFTLAGGRPVDVVYHVTMLPVLVLTLVLSVVWARRRSGDGSGSSGQTDRNLTA